MWLLLLPLCCTAETAAGERGGELSGLSAEDRINLLCLRSAYPQIRAVESGPDGIWLRLEGERRVLYASAAELAGVLSAGALPQPASKETVSRAAVL